MNTAAPAAPSERKAATASAYARAGTTKERAEETAFAA